jgi:hypothetical protein
VARGSGPAGVAAVEVEVEVAEAVEAEVAAVVEVAEEARRNSGT